VTILFGLAVFFLVASIALWAFYATWMALRPDDVEESLDDVMSNGDVEEMFEMLNSRNFPSMSRYEIWQRTACVWRETHILTADARGLATMFLLVFFSLLCLLLGLKTLLVPNSEDLRLLLGAELFILCQAGPRQG